MSLKTFLEEQKQERKQRKLERKQKKKAPLTKSQKFYKIAGVIVAIMITFGALGYACSSMGEGVNDWSEIIGLNSEMVDELKKPVDQNLLFSEGKILAEDLTTCKEKMLASNCNIWGEEDVEPSSNFLLNGFEVGALVNDLFSRTGQAVGQGILFFDIYSEGEYFYEKSIINVTIKDTLTGKNLPTIYLTLISKIDILAGELCILETDVKINQLDDEINKEIVEALDTNMDFQFSLTINSLINSTIGLFARSAGLTFGIVDNGIEFRI